MTFEKEEERLRALLREALPGVETDGPERDLWPRMLERMSARAAIAPWYDWALGAALAMSLLLAPRAIPVLLYYL